MHFVINLDDLQKIISTHKWIRKSSLTPIIEEKFDKLKELDYKELLKMKIDPKDLHFSTRPVKFESFFESKKYLDFMHDLIAYCRVSYLCEKSSLNNLL